jgi:hypothetical protein
MVAGTSIAEADELVAQAIATSKTRPRLACASCPVALSAKPR